MLEKRRLFYEFLPAWANRPGKNDSGGPSGRSRGQYSLQHETYAPDVQYMVIVSKDAEEVHEELKKRNINYMGQEQLFDSESCPLCTPEYLEKENLLYRK